MVSNKIEKSLYHFALDRPKEFAWCLEALTNQNRRGSTTVQGT
jgi:hypothetical protein